MMLLRAVRISSEIPCRDISDHTHVEGNVFKMLLGSTDTCWDNQTSDA
jgi:hypothetical protein